MINGDEQRSKVAKRKATAPVGGIFQKKKSQDRINPGPSDRIRSRTTERPNDLLHKEWDTMEHDCIKYVRSCQQCQIYADKEKVLIPLNNMTTPWPFSMCGISMSSEI